MIAPDLETAITRLRDLIETSETIVPFTGAGISTECGIPDFRSPGGIWTKMAPIPFDAFLASPQARDESWRRRFAMQDQFGDARPGRGHRALATLFRTGKSPGVVTQNIDNLHQMSGIPGECVVELHGNTTYAQCLDCAKRYELDWVRKAFDGAGGRAPECPDCQDSDDLVRAIDAAARDGPRPGADPRLRSFPGHRLLAGGVARGRISPDGEAQWRTVGDPQSRGDRVR
jgi:NAD-dependent deacetylase